MVIAVRTDENGKLLFEWSPEDNTIDIVRKDEKLRIRLIKQGGTGSYEIVTKEKKKKAQRKNLKTK